MEAHILLVDKLEGVAPVITDPLPPSSKRFKFNFFTKTMFVKYIYMHFFKVTCDMITVHVTPDRQWVVDIVSKFQFSSSYSLGEIMF